LRRGAFADGDDGGFTMLMGEFATAIKYRLPKVTLEQATHFAEALVRGAPDRGKIALTLFRDKLNELL
jgi:hypothetical protein